MAKIDLIIESPTGRREISLNKDRIIIGRSKGVDIQIEDDKLANVHASIHQQSGKIWILDQGSFIGSYVNNQRVPATGLPLKQGDRIRLSDRTTIIIGTSSLDSSQSNSTSNAASKPDTRQFSWSFPLIVGSSLLALISIGLLVIYLINSAKPAPIKPAQHIEPTITIEEQKIPQETIDQDQHSENGTVDNGATPTPTPTPQPEITPLPDSKKVKLYLAMSEAERLEFIDERAQHIAVMMGNRPYDFNDDVLRYIKKYLDGYAQRANSSSLKLWGEGLPSLYGRATKYAPYIIKSFNARGVPPVVGLYIVMIETEYHDCLESPVGAKGLFQFMPETARGYGVDPADRCDVQKMAPAAAHYMADRITEFGPDAMSVALGIAGYNRSPDSVRRDLHDVLNSENKERSFWTLVANSTKLDRPFQNENIKYVPKFFAAAIVGETPWAFGLQLRPLSTYTEPGKLS